MFTRRPAATQQCTTGAGGCCAGEEGESDRSAGLVWLRQWRRARADVPLVRGDVGRLEEEFIRVDGGNDRSGFLGIRSRISVDDCGGAADRNQDTGRRVCGRGAVAAAAAFLWAGADS